MGSAVVVRPDQVTLGVLVDAVPRDAVDEAVAVCGKKERRSDGKLPAHVITYLTLGLALFAEDDYEEVAAKVTGSLDRFGCWDAAWAVPTSSAITQARKRLGREVFPELFERTCGPVAGGSFLRGWRLLAIDGFEVDLPDTEPNAAEFGYAGSGANRSALPKARVVAVAECGTHAFVAAQVDAYKVGEQTMAARLYPRLRADELLTADRNFYSWAAWDSAAATGAALLWRAPTQLVLPVIEVLPDGTYLSVVMDSRIRGTGRDHDHRPGAGPRGRAGRRVPPAVGGRNRERPAQDPPARAGQGAAFEAAGPGPPGDLGLPDRAPRDQRPDRESLRRGRPGPGPDLLHQGAAPDPPYRYRDGGHFPLRTGPTRSRAT